MEKTSRQTQNTRLHILFGLGTLGPDVPMSQPQMDVQYEICPGEKLLENCREVNEQKVLIMETDLLMILLFLIKKFRIINVASKMKLLNQAACERCPNVS